MNLNRSLSEGAKDAARARSEALVEAVARVINETDPKSLLEVGCPPDEYSPEIGTITPRVAGASGPAEAREILHEEFERWFGVGEAGSVDAWDIPATAIWQAVLAFRQAG